MFEAVRAGLEKTDYLKIIALQTADFAIGTIPIAGDIIDYMFKVNNSSKKIFIHNSEEIREEAERLGISSEEIAKVEESAKMLPRLIENTVEVFGKRK